MVVEDAVGGSNHCLGCDGICEADTRSEVIPVRFDQCLLAQRSLCRCDELSGRGIKIGPLEISFARRRREFVTQTEVHGQVWGHSPVVLNETKKHVLIHLECRIRILLVSSWETEQQIRYGVFPSAVVAAETALKIKLAQQRADVPNACLDVEQLSTEFDSMCAPAPGQGLADVEAARSLKLWLRRRPANPSRSRSVEVESREAAADCLVRRRVLQADQLFRTSRAKIRRELEIITQGISEPRIGNQV